MAKTDRAALTSALGSLLGGMPTPPPDPPADVAHGATVAPAANVATDATAADEHGTYARTSTGYRRGDGDLVKRLSLFLTDAQRRELRRQAATAGYESVAAYVVARLGLDGPA